MNQLNPKFKDMTRDELQANLDLAENQWRDENTPMDVFMRLHHDIKAMETELKLREALRREYSDAALYWIGQALTLGTTKGIASPAALNADRRFEYYKAFSKDPFYVAGETDA